jgi:hypothetical protein
MALCYGYFSILFNDTLYGYILILFDTEMRIK